ncbi:MAG: hypothetical protein WCY62_01345 [Clostridia bacterium]
MSGVMLNWDDSAFFYYLSKGYGNDAKSRDEAVDYCKAIVGQYDGTGVTDFLMCLNSRLASYPSKSIENYGDSFRRKQQNGKDVDFAETWVRSFHEIYEKWGFDYFEVWIQRLREIKINPWISVRMNDAHETLSETSCLAPEYFYENPGLRRVRHHRESTYFDNLFDYGSEKIRKRYLAFIDESLARYDVYGIEIDWMREIFCFEYGREYSGIDVINNFMHEVKKIVSWHENKKGHTIKIAARIPVGLETSYYMGFDAITWAKQRLIDTLVISPRWGTTDTDMPIELWKKVLAPYNVGLAAGIEIILRENRSYPITFNCAETVYASATAIFSAGADKVYLFNYMRAPDLTMTDKNNKAGMTIFSDYKGLLNTIKDLDTVMSAQRRHLVSYRDILPEWECRKFQVPVVCKASDSDYASFRVRTGNIAKGSSVRIILGIDSERDLDSKDITVYINSRPAEFAGKLEEDNYYCESPLYDFSAVNTGVMNQVNTVEVCSNSVDFTVKHIEIRVLPVRREK